MNQIASADNATPTRSLRIRLRIIIALVLLPLLFLNSGIFYFLYQGIGEYNSALDETIEKLIPLSELAFLVVQAPMPANDYLLHHRKSERSNFQLIQKEVDRGFDRVIKIYQDEEKILKILQTARSKWEEGKVISLDILLDKNADDRPGEIEAMESLDELLSHVGFTLSSIRSDLLTSTLQRYKIANLIGEKMPYVALTFFLTSITLIGSGVYYLYVSVSRPIKSLHVGAQLFRQGEFQHRIRKWSDDELGQLVDTLNKMAEKIVEDRQELNRLATTDPLTGLVNQRQFWQTLERELSRLGRTGGALTLITFDLDHFKSVNDRYGHSAGDQVLVETAKRMGDCLRPVDILARYGGEEMVAILPDTDCTGAMDAAERVRLVIQNNPVHLADGTSISVTVSAGVTTTRNSQDTAKALFDRADLALYGAKESGRNCVVSQC